MVVLGASFQSIIAYDYMNASITQATHEGTKKLYCQGEFYGHVSQSRDFTSRDSRCYHGRPMQDALQESGSIRSGYATFGGQVSCNMGGGSSISSLVEGGRSS